MEYREKTNEGNNGLVEKFSKGRCSHDEALTVIKWFKEPSYQIRLFQALRKLWYRDLETEENKEETIDLQSTLDKIHHRINYSMEHEVSILHKRVRLNKKLLRAASVLLLPLLAMSIFYIQERFDLFAKDVLYTEVSVPYGSKLHTVLPDGTEVWLNSGSTLKYPQSFSKNNRHALLSGEAFFNVTHDRSHSFVVKTEAFDLKVIGTQFNVMAYPEDDYVSATLEEGKISVEKQGTDKKNSRICFLNPNERIVGRKGNGSFKKTIVNTDKFTSWKDDRLIFQNDPLELIIERLERWYNTDIEIANNGNLPQTPYTMTIEDETIVQVLEYLSLASGISYEVVPAKKQENGQISKRKYIIRNIE